MKREGPSMIKYGPPVISIHFEGAPAPGSSFFIQRDSACIVYGAYTD